MAFVTGLMLIDAPASALNNSGSEEGARTDNTIGVKKIRTRQGSYPYVSAQSVRYWLRTMLEHSGSGWKSAPVSRETKIAYTDGNPIEWWDDDLFGYMRAESKKAGAKGEQPVVHLTPTSTELTRVSPFRLSTFVSVAPVDIVDDFGTMTRHAGDPVPHEHQFYRATLQGQFSLNLSTAGTFFANGHVGYRNLDVNRVKIAEDKGLSKVTICGQQAYRLSLTERSERVATLIKTLAQMEGGAKLSLHYTDVAPPWLIMAVTKSGNHPFLRTVRANAKGQPEIVIDALKEILSVYADDFLSDIYIGWAKGFMDDQRQVVESLSADDRSKKNFQWGHPREVAQKLASELTMQENSKWFD